MTDRIRWHDEPSGGMAACTGSVGTLNPAMFHIWRPDAHCAEWQLTTRLHDMEQKHCYGGDPEELKAEAERWLEEFTASIGAVFPGAHCSECGFTVPRHDHDKSCSHYRDPAAPEAGKD